MQFRRWAKQEFARLLGHWASIEPSIKQVEQVQKAAAIPAINELRYASRRLYAALSVYGKGSLTDQDKDEIRKHLTICEQYLLNADHDTIDGVVGHYSRTIERLRNSYGEPEITLYFPQFPKLKEDIRKCEELIHRARADQERRRESYDYMREKYFDYLAQSFEVLQQAEINAEYSKQKLERELAIKSSTVTVLSVISVIGGIASVLAFAWSIWVYVNYRIQI